MAKRKRKAALLSLRNQKSMQHLAKDWTSIVYLHTNYHAFYVKKNIQGNRLMHASLDKSVSDRTINVNQD